MTDDLGHGTYAGAVAHWKRKEKLCDPCAQAAFRKRKERSQDEYAGRTRRLSIVGFRRRVEALQAIGYPLREIADALDISQGLLSVRFYRSQWISRENHEQMVAAYEALCMSPRPENVRTILNARRRGYAPPLAWDDDIDDPAAIPRGMVDTDHQGEQR